MKITHTNGHTDSRYTVTLEHSGYVGPTYTARFCGDYIGQAAPEWQAWLICAEHKAARIGGNSGDYLNGKNGI